ncbi:hypothetical protein [Variovorax sp. UMC13]|uniref:hypothetical protein n=1 Tax=Variovorax sp. UMC13 TaxID=1862326 RepID=UPI0016000876|nr:hypothetical protein [Variovorax sp. UMC13]MBB1599945.1 hypothetical protein [Variovorax sp. UMC13]
MSAAEHTPSRQCGECEGACLQPATIDDAMTVLAVACTRRDQLIACEALATAALARAQQLRADIAKTAGALA